MHMLSLQTSIKHLVPVTCFLQLLQEHHQVRRLQKKKKRHNLRNSCLSLFMSSKTLLIVQNRSTWVMSFGSASTGCETAVCHSSSPQKLCWLFEPECHVTRDVFCIDWPASIAWWKLTSFLLLKLDLFIKYNGFNLEDGSKNQLAVDSSWLVSKV